MKKDFLYIRPFLLSVLFFLFGCSNYSLAQSLVQSDEEQEATMTPFEHTLGINLSTWLSHTEAKNGAEARDYFLKKDFDALVAIGFDHIRLPIAEYMLYTSGLERDEETFKLIDQLVGWCQEANVKLIINFHIPRIDKKKIWASQEERDKIVAIWSDLSKAFRKYPNETVAYEIFNEPGCPDNQMWNEFAAAMISEIRKEEPCRVIVLGPNGNNAIEKLPDLVLPQDDKNLIVSVHFYAPALLTHYGVGKLKNMKVKLNYPGQIVTTEVLETLTEEQKAILKPFLGNFTYETLKTRLAPLVEFSKRKGVRVRCGEFGYNNGYEKAMGDTTIQPRWTRDVTAAFRSLGIPHSFWGYKSTFGLFENDGTIKNEQTIKALQGKDIE